MYELGSAGQGGATVGHPKKSFVCAKCMIGKYGDILGILTRDKREKKRFF